MSWQVQYYCVSEWVRSGATYDPVKTPEAAVAAFRDLMLQDPASGTPLEIAVWCVNIARGKEVTPSAPGMPYRLVEIRE